MSINSIESEILGLISHAPKTEKSVAVPLAVRNFEDAARTGCPARIVSLTCANYETLLVKGKKVPVLHKELVWNDGGLRGGYVAAKEEIPEVLNRIQQCNIPLRHSIVLVDLGMADQLWGERAQEFHDLDENQIKLTLKNTVSDNVATLHSLVKTGMADRNLDPDVVRVVRLSAVLGGLKESGIDLEGVWNSIAQAMHAMIEVPNNHVAGLLRQGLKKDAAYLRYAWGMNDQDEIKTRVVDQTFALTAAIGYLLPKIEATVWDDAPVSRDQLVMLDTIPGPDNPGHTEFRMYNLPVPGISENDMYDSKGDFRKVPILRPLANRVLFSQPAVESPLINKTLGQMIKEANKFEI